jgi:hypothetical protein
MLLHRGIVQNGLQDALILRDHGGAQRQESQRRDEKKTFASDSRHAVEPLGSIMLSLD